MSFPLLPPRRVFRPRYSLGKLLLLIVLVSAWFAWQPKIVSAAEQFTGPWNLESLRQTPPSTWGAKLDGVREVYYEGATIDGRPTRVFAYVAFPNNEAKKSAKRVPGMVLVHGGGGAAFAEWAKLWADRGYAAIAMDLQGRGPDKKPLPDGGPALKDANIFRNFSDADVDRMWSYQAVAAVIRGHSVLASCNAVDSDRIGVTGISWGGYLTSIVAGLDDRFKVAVPVYGSGFLHENSHSDWLEALAKMSPDSRARWIALFDPSKYLPQATMPMLFVNGTNDAAFPLDSYQKSYRLPRGPVSVRVEVGMPHGHPPGWAPKEIGWFVDSVLAGGDPLPRLGALKVADGRVSAEVVAKRPTVKAQLHYAKAEGEWQTRAWKSAEATIIGGRVEAELPAERPLVYFLSVTDDRGAMTTSEHVVAE